MPAKGAFILALAAHDRRQVFGAEGFLHLFGRHKKLPPEAVHAARGVRPQAVLANGKRAAANAFLRVFLQQKRRRTKDGNFLVEPVQYAVYVAFGKHVFQVFFDFKHPFPCPGQVHQFFGREGQIKPTARRAGQPAHHPGAEHFHRQARVGIQQGFVVNAAALVRGLPVKKAAGGRQVGGEFLPNGRPGGALVFQFVVQAQIIGFRLVIIFHRGYQTAGVCTDGRNLLI